ncbi:aldo/keto reductase [Nocardia sp. NBC_00881]|uniref:aldo/keto reductase n=1 Tax=Nocardia sp. NBC_00881 TaxID=2975995 RepID=UPI00386F1F0F|nr:aldo/keto reductase [Nocardia sp. NBC_00881]
MITRTLGASGLEVSALGVGCWAIGGPDTNLGLPIGWGPIDDSIALAGLERAYELGVSLFDVADVYGHGRAERTLGRLVAQVPRSSLTLSSKVGYFTGTAEHGYHPTHIRHQLEQTLDNLGTDHLDIYFFHHPEFGADDKYLDGAIETMHDFLAKGLIRTIGLRGPHRYALDRVTGTDRGDKYSRFHHLFTRIRPDILAVRDNLLTPQSRSGIFTVADEHDCGVLITKPLSQGLLTGSHDPNNPRRFGPGDHRSRKHWFTPAAIATITEGLDKVRAHVGPAATDLIRSALWSCLQRSDNAAVLVGFTTPEQILTNINCLADAPSPDQIDTVRTIMAAVQQRLDAAGEVFIDQTPPEGAGHG